MPDLIIRNKDGEELERHSIDCSLLSFIKKSCQDQGVEYKDTARPPYSAFINGKFWPYENHDDPLKDSDIIELTIEPGDPVTIILTAIALAAAAYSYYSISNIPTDYQDTTESGDSIYTANVNANSVNPSGVIREMAGEQQIYPDLICPPRRKYVGNEEFLYLNLAVTRGYADINDENVYIAETPITYYSGDYLLQVKDPGEDISGHEAYENWYESDEVSSLELVSSLGLVGGAWTIDTNLTEITSYLDGVATQFPFEVGQEFELESSSNSGIYRVSSLSGVTNEIATVLRLIYVAVDAGGGRELVVDPNFVSLNPSAGETITEWAGLSSGLNYEGPYVGVPENETSRYGEYDIRFPAGLVQLVDGAQSSRTVTVEIDWREYGTSTWTTHSEQTTAATYDEVGKTIEIDYGSEIRPEFRARRVTDDSTSIDISDQVELRRVKHLLESPSSYPDITTMQLRLRGTNALAVTAQNKVNLRGASRKLPTLQEIQDAANGTPFDLSSDNNISTAWDIQYASLSNIEDFANKDTSLSDAFGAFDVSEDGLNLVVFNNNYIMYFVMTEPFDFRTSEYTGRHSSGGALLYNNGVRILSGGSKIAILQTNSSPDERPLVIMAELSTPYDPNTAVIGSNGYFLGGFGQGSSSMSVFFDPSGSRYWWNDSGTIKEVQMSSNLDLTTSSFTGDELDVSVDVPGSVRGMCFGDSLSKLYVSNGDSDIFSYTMSTPGDITTASLDSPSSINVSSGNGCLDLVVYENNLLSFDVIGGLSNWIIPSTINARRSRSIVRFCANAIYDAIGPDVLTQIDFDSLDTLESTLELRGDYLDAEFKDETTLWEAIKIMAAPGYSEPVIKEGVFSFVRIVEGSDFAQLYTPDIMTGDGLQIDMEFYGSQEPDGVDIEYFNLETYSNEVYEYRLPGDEGLSPKRIQSIGIGTEEKAFRMAARERRTDRAKPNSYTFTTEMDALNSNYGDPIAIASDVFGGEYGQVLGVSGSVVIVDFEPDPSFDTATFRNPDGTMASTHSVSVSGNEITLVSPSSPSFTLISDENQEPNLVTIGSVDNYVKRAIVRRISPQGENEVQVTAEEYVIDIYTDDNNTPS